MNSRRINNSTDNKQMTNKENVKKDQVIKTESDVILQRKTKRKVLISGKGGKSVTKD